MNEREVAEMANKKGSRQLTWTDRISIEALKKAGHSVIEIAALDRLERKWGADMFKRVFKTITVDNGSEFADAEGLQRSIINEGEKRTKVYYCHPYSSWERGTNEVTNKMIRRKIPKGTNFDDRTEEEVESIENWINGYPRKIHGYHSAGELFKEEVKQLA